MSKAAVDFWFFFTLFGGLPLGIILAVLWAKKVLPYLLRIFAAQKRIVPAGIGIHSLLFMIPGLLALILCCVPVMYFGNLRKQREYCLQVVAVNKGITKESRFLLERCGCFDIDELFAENAADGE